MTDDAGLWPFALKLYHAPGVADACLVLQSRLGADVNLVLFAAWIGAHGHALTEDEISGARVRVAAWHDEIVRSLRAVRMRMKHGPSPAPTARTEELRTKLKEVEIEAEKIELEALEVYAETLAARAHVKEAADTNIKMLLPTDHPEAIAAMRHIANTVAALV